MHRGARTSVWIAVGLLLIAACGGSKDPAVQSPIESAASCGSRLFLSETCESQVNYLCCIQKQECGRDASCSQLSECLLKCKRNRAGEVCSSACATSAAPSPERQRGLSLWYGVIDCASKARVPKCGDDS